MSCPFATVESISPVSIKPILRADPQIGTEICFYDQKFLWTAEHRTPSELNEWRKRGDSPVDLFFQIYGEDLHDGDDTYEIIHQLAEDKTCSIESIANFSEKIRQRPIWFDRDEIQRGQNFFLRHTPQVLTSIFHYTLILGYGFQQLNDVLLKTQYLSSSDLHSTYRRLIETFQMIGTAMCGDVDNFDQTFSDVVRVRFLHAMVRYKITKNRRQINDEEIPINQEDQLITLLGFSFSVLYCMEQKMNIPVTNEDKYAYLHLWRYIGWLMGIEDEYLTYLRSYQSAQMISESIFYHFYSPTNISKHMAHHSLMASYFYGELPLSFQCQIGFSRFLLGKEISEALSFDSPPIDWLNAFAIRFFLSTLRFGAWLIRQNSSRLNQWIAKRSRQRLCFIIFTGLENQLCNFSLFKSYRAEKRRNGTSLKECSCRFHEKKQFGSIETNDIGPIRMKKTFSFLPFLQQSFILLILILFVRFYSNVNL